MSKRAFLFRAFGSRNYRLFFTGQSISLIGTWMQQTAMSWLVYRLTGSPWLLGLTGFATQVPSFFVAPLAGVFIDRWNRHRLLVVTQTLAMVQALLVALLVLTGTVQVWHILLLSLFLGTVNAFDIPGRQSFLIEMLGDKTLLGNAIALNSSMVNGARMVGPSVAGILIASMGEGVCFVLNALSYLAVIASLLLMQLTPRELPVHRTPVLQGLREGARYAFGFGPVRSIILLLSLLSFTGTPYIVLMPIFARDILHGEAHTLGFLMASIGVGALTGAMFLASRKNILGLGKNIALASAIFGAALIAFSFSRVFWISVVLLFAAGFGMMVQMASGNTIIQTIVDDDKRGRVMSFYTVAFIGMVPFGSLVQGAMASHIGAPETLMIGGTFCLMGSLVFTWKLPAFRKALGLACESKERAVEYKEHKT